MTNFTTPPIPRRKRASDESIVINPRFRGLASQLLSEALQNASGQAIGVASSSSGEGVTNTATNLAVNAAALADSPILLIDVASNRKTLYQFLGVNATPGATAVLNEQQPLTAVVQDTRHRNLTFLSSGATSQQHDVRAWETLLEDAKRAFHLVLLDLPPVPALSSQMGNVGNLDSVLLVIESGRTRKQAVLRSQSLLERMGLKPLGIVLNKRRNDVPSWLYDKI